MRKGKGGKCPECGSLNIVRDYDTGEIVCGACGLVILEQEMDRRPEWRAYTLEEINEKTRTGIPSSFSVHDKDLGTILISLDSDALRRKLPASTRAEMWRLRKWQIRSRVHTSVERNLAQAMTELDRLLDRLEIKSQSVKEEAARIYRKALKKGLVRGRTINEIVSASLYAACRKCRIPRTLNEISDESFVIGSYQTTKYKRKCISRCYRLLIREIDLQMPIDDPLLYISKIAKKTGISEKTQGLAVEILQQAQKKHIHFGKDPKGGISAALLYIACLKSEEKRTQRELAAAAGVTDVTVRNRYKELIRKLGPWILL